MVYVGQITPVQVNIRDAAKVRAAVAGADAVINLVGVLYESGKQRFDAVQTTGAETVAKAARAAGCGAVRGSDAGRGPSRAPRVARPVDQRRQARQPLPAARAGDGGRRGTFRA